MNNNYIPTVPLRDVVIFPDMTVPLYIGRKETLLAIETSLKLDRQLVVVTQKKIETEELQTSDIYQIGSLGNILQIMRLPNRNIKILFEAKKRVKIKNFSLIHNYYQSDVEILNQKETLENKSFKLIKIIQQNISHYLEENENTKELNKMLKKLEKKPAQFCDFLASILEMNIEKKQKILEEVNVSKRLDIIFKSLLEEEQKKKIDSKIKERVYKQVWKNQREFYLNEQLKAIKKELGDTQNIESVKNKKSYSEKIKEAELPKNAREIVEEELEKLDSMPSFATESNIIKSYVDWILQVPWKKNHKESYNLKNVIKVLNQHHYGLEKVKERILEFIAVTKVVGKLKGPILCLLGPPGVGKSSLAETVASAMKREFCRISLGGVRDEAEIRGHRRTYIGAMPGKIIQSMKKVKTTNPLILLDEIDKISRSNMGDPAAALLEVLDPEQNYSFVDHYLDIEYDLSQVLFFCTANDVREIPSALLDRMEMITLSGYTEIEKKNIFQKHLFPKITKENGLDSKQVSISGDSILYIIQHYTREAGIRELERCLSKICRKITKEFITSNSEKKISITKKKLKHYLGVEKYSYNQKNEKSTVGVATGMAWTNYGGDLLAIEVSCMKGNSHIHLTGKLGDVMQESAKASLSFVKSNANNLGIYSDIFSGMDIHIHIPEGATPKDGPSAGIALTTALVSNLTGIPAYNTIAMTGEISLRGRVLEIGGLKEKLLAAKRGGITNVIIPQKNEKDLEEIPKEILESLEIHPVNNIWNVLEIALERMPQPVDDKDLNRKDQAKEISNVLKKSSLFQEGIEKL